MQSAINNDTIPAGNKKTAPVTNVVKLDPINPIPIDYGANIFTVISGQRYIPFLGDTDNLPNVFWEARLLSNTHNACITSIAETCVGGGIQVMNKEPEAVDKDFITFISRLNKKQHLNDVVKLGMEAELTDGNAWMEIVKGDVAGKKYVRAYLHTSLVCRFQDPGKDKEDPTHVVKSQRFADKRNRILSNRSLKAVVFPLYSENELDKNASWKKPTGSSDLHSIIHLCTPYSGVLHYGLPKSSAGLRYQVLEGKSAQYNIDNFDNNMVLGGMIVFKNAMTPAEANANAREILKTHTGQGKNGRIAVISSETGIDDFEFKEFNTQKEGSFIEFDKRIEEKIIVSNNWDAVFFGMGAQSSLGKGSEYIRSIYDIKKTTVIDPLCVHWMENFIKPLIAIAADHMGKPEWLKYELGFKTAMPFSYSSDINVNKVVSKNEGRLMLGMTEKDGKEWEEPIDSGKPPVQLAKPGEEEKPIPGKKVKKEEEEDV